MKNALIIENLIKQFGENASISRIAKYAELEYMIPYSEAVFIIYDLTQ